ncbi:uncharacterized protein K452DRAFT_285180 [Aplosporella prunicola CBS 121167]|uniref:Peptidase A1 domain-containing protein n=1 Tax=Aplosporella prunicola CBS 121167 TaxID=1176127 RepID=A0A6A6BIM8_9PEZI|nr:uncharacterized protein K452DRAFT_285180 [Aplosporella prunicola CBS 121167]KAF2143979.1 hypothetical protein K452DRAFT_285180 [Aplosporella prunicola CBS 121167]
MRDSLGSALIIASALLPAARAATPEPWPLWYNETVGPDGPWNAIHFSIDFPDQHVTFHPSLLETSLIINASACQASSASCPLPTPGMWEGSGAQSLSAWKNSASFEPTALTDEAGKYMTDVMGLEGNMRYIAERFVLQANEGRRYKFLDNHVSAVSDNLTVKYPGGTSYTLDVGYWSLNGMQDTFGYKSANGSQLEMNTTLADAVLQDAVASTSYSLHVGSVSQNISGSLYLGGYDRTRCIGTPIATDDNSYLYLADVELGVAEGGSAFINTSAKRTTGLLKTNGTNAASLPLSTRPDPGVPYMYLPGATCDAIAAYLPVQYDADFDLYLWDTTDAAYTKIINSPHYLSFSFHTAGKSGTTQNIDIPFALLNLTLSAPLTPSPTPYFPCRPYDPSQSDSAPSTILGRAFLQGAFLAQNFDSKYLWLAQAPGPGAIDSTDVHVIDADSTSLTAAISPVWNATWSSVLKPLAGDASGTDSAGGGDKDSASDSGLSTGAKIGIGIGVGLGAAILLLLLALFFLRRKKQQRRHTAVPTSEPSPALIDVDGPTAPPYEAQQPGSWAMQDRKVGEMAPAVGELDSSNSGAGVQELPSPGFEHGHGHGRGQAYELA